MAFDTASEKLGRYEILSALGQGAMGVVYKAVDPMLDRTVAIKTIKFDQTSEESAGFEERFYREAKSAGRLNHPNIVTIYDVGKSDNTAYIAMELLEGNLLKDFLDVHTALPIDKIVDIAAQIADGLAYAHKNGIIHRDIKPANIMLIHGDRVKITDFGIARMSTSSGTLAGTVIGSPRYMAPEQVVGKPVDGRSDVFALGVVLYELLTGESPFDGDNINTTMYRIVNEAPTPPKTVNPRLPEIFDYIVAKALAKHPDERYQSAKELATDLRNYKNLSLSQSVAASLNYPITLERKPKPISKPKPPASLGEETICLVPPGKAQSRPIPAANSIPPHVQVQTRAGVGIIAGPYRNFLMGVGVIVVGGIFWNQMREKPAAQPKTALPVPVVIPVPPLVKEQLETPTWPGNAVQLPPDVNAEQRRSGVKAQTSPPAAMAANVAPKARAAVSDAAQSESKPNPDTAPQHGEARLDFAVTPWGEVYVDGKKMGASPPLKELKVSAGRHKIEIRNLNFAPYSETLQLKADSTKKLKHIFK